MNRGLGKASIYGEYEFVSKDRSLNQNVAVAANTEYRYYVILSDVDIFRCLI